MKLNEYIEEVLDFSPKLNDNYGDWLGYEILRFDRKSHYVETSLKIRESQLSPSGSVHGGVISGFLDISCGCAVFLSLNDGEMCSTVDLGVKYFRPLAMNDKLVAKAKVINRGNKLCSVVTNLYLNDNHEDAVALATATFNIYKIP